MITLQVSCSNHQKQDGSYGRDAEINLDTIDGTTARKVKRELENNGWVVQFNGNHMDTYCSKICAQ
jgi:hypothetical protein